MKLVRLLILIQSLYILVTATWPILSIDSFMMVTGYKTDVWLVKTVSALLLAIGTSLISFLHWSVDYRPAFALGCFTALGLLFIDVYYATTEVISDVYLADAFIEAVLSICWIFLACKHLLKNNS
jgi:hypothetical protein